MTRRGLTSNARVRLERREQVAWIELRLRGSGGFVDYDAACSFVEAVEEVEWQEDVIAVVVTSDGEDFCLGSREEWNWPAAVPWVQSIACLSVPVIGAVHGRAIAEGCELALACDLRWIREDARFALPHLSEGRLPRHGGTQRLPRLVGRMRALELLWTGRTVSAREALKVGLATRILPRSSWRSELRRACAALAGRAPLALRYGKEAVLRGIDTALAAGLRLEEDLYVLLQSTADRKEGIRAFFERRKPRFCGR